MDLRIFPLFQPVEIVKPLFIIFVAKIIILNEKINVYRRYLYSFLVLLTYFSIFNKPTRSWTNFIDSIQLGLQ